MKDKSVLMDDNNGFDPNRDKAWYVISSFTGYEFKVESDLRAKLRNQFSDCFDEVLIITEEQTETVITPSGKEKQRVKVVNLFPGYIYARLIMTDEVWFAIRNTKYVSGIIGSHGSGAKPTPISDEDMNRLLSQNDRRDLLVRTDVEFNVGDHVMIESGPFAGHTGVVDAFEKTKNVVRLLVEKFDNASIVVETNNIKKVGSLKNANLG